MDIIMAGQHTTIPSQELTKDSSASEDDHPEPKTQVSQPYAEYSMGTSMRGFIAFIFIESFTTGLFFRYRKT